MTDLPRTPQQILEEYERRSKELFDFGTSDLIEVLPFDMARKYLKDEITYGGFVTVDGHHTWLGVMLVIKKRQKADVTVLQAAATRLREYL